MSNICSGGSGFEAIDLTDPYARRDYASGLLDLFRAEMVALDEAINTFDPEVYDPEAPGSRLPILTGLISTVSGHRRSFLTFSFRLWNLARTLSPSMNQPLLISHRGL